jgi:ankyrin repeat protein
MRAINNSSVTPTDNPNQNKASTDTKPAFVYLYDREIDDNSIKFCTRIAKISHLQNHVLEFGAATNTITAVHHHLKTTSKQSSHLMLNVHGGSTGSKGQRSHRFVAGSSERREFFTKQWLEKLLCPSAEAINSETKTIPFVHVLSCRSKALAEEIKPGTPLWKSGWFILYSSSKVTSVNHFGSSLEVMASYLQLCESNDVQANPLTLFYLAGLARGDCMTLLGGDLEQPLTLHAPKSQRDLEHTRSIKICEGNPVDKARLLLAGIELSSQERSLLPDPKDNFLIAQLLATRIERGDMIAVKKIVKEHPELLDRHQVVGTLPLATTIKNNDPEQMKWLLNHGAKINSTDSDGYSLLFYAIEFQDARMLEFLLTNGANPNSPNHESVTPLIVAIEHGKTKAAELLIKYGADLTWTDEDDTALTLAVSEGHLSIVNCILEHSTDRGTGLSAQLVQQARSNGQEDIALVLEQALQKRPAWKN